ncbi:AraC family transcriptional regulator, partial [Mesorhizobium sp. M2E.F.Ca.ET.209.01.1.1]
EQFMRGGMSLIASDVHNRFPYVATAQQRPGLAIRVMLQGQVDVRIPRRGAFTLRAGTAMTAQHRDQIEMTGAHPGQTRMRGVSVIVPAGVDAEVFRMPLLEKALDTHLECRHWAIPHAMLPVLGQLFDRPWQDGIDALWREGVALQ